MNKIIVNNGLIIVSARDNIHISENNIYIKKDTTINLEYSSTSNIEINFYVDPNISAKIYLYSLNNNIIIKNKYELLENSKLFITKFYNNYKTIETETIDLNGQKAQIKYYLSAICEKEDQYILNINHFEKSTKSEIINRLIAKENTNIDLEINARVLNSIPNCELTQSSKIITLGKSNSQIKPNMYIDEHNVIAKHSSVVSKFNNTEVFYLMSRGISYSDSLKLLIKGFLLSSEEWNMETSEKVLTTINKYWR